MKQSKDVPSSKKTNTYTPGPWTAQPIGDESECNILGARRELVATVSDNDANLIASAPVLLESAKIISGWIERVAEEVTMGPDDQKALNNLRMAIAKAEGGK